MGPDEKGRVPAHVAELLPGNAGWTWALAELGQAGLWPSLLAPAGPGSLL